MSAAVVVAALYRHSACVPAICITPAIYLLSSRHSLHAFSSRHFAMAGTDGLPQPPLHTLSTLCVVTLKLKGNHLGMDGMDGG